MFVCVPGGAEAATFLLDLTKMRYVTMCGQYRKMPIFRTPTVISDKPGGFAAFLATGKLIDKYKILKLVN